MNFRLIAGTIAASLALSSAWANAAANYQFTLVGAYAATWQQSATPIPNDVFVGDSFTLWDVHGDFLGANSSAADLTFFSSARGGGMGIYDFNAGINLLSTDGPQLYAGSEGSPTFAVGTFALTEYQGLGGYTLTVSEVSTVPEPGALALVLFGFVGIAAARRGVA